MSDVKTAPTNAPRGKPPAPAKAPVPRRSEPVGDNAGQNTSQATAQPTGESAGQAAAAGAARMMSELKVSGHLMALEQGLYCITHAPALGAEGGNLPGVRISTPPQVPGALERIAIASFRPDGFLHASGDAALVRVLAPTAQVLVTIYQSGAPDGAAPNIQVRRLLEPLLPAAAAPRVVEAPAAKPGTAAADAGAKTGVEQPAARPGAVMEMVAHIQERADVGGMLGEWLGERGSRRWIEGFGVMPHGLAPADVEYQAVLGRGWLSPWVEGGQFCGSRGMALPVLGFRIRLRNGVAETHEVVYSATFIDGSEVGPVADGEPCESEALAAMEAFHITVRPRGQAAVDAAAHDPGAEGGQPAGGKPPASRARSAPAPAPVPRPRPARTGRAAKAESVRPERPILNVLFVHQNFPGQYLHIVRRLARDPGNKLVFISESNANRIEGVHRAFYQPPKPNQDAIHPMARDWDLASRRAELVATAASNLKRLGFTPDIIIGHHGWGELLNLPDVWPGVPILGYFEFYYDSAGQDVGYDPEFPVGPERFARIRAMNTINLMSLSLEQHGQTPTRWQHTRYPDWAQAKIGVLPEGVPIDTCAPDPAVRKAPFKLNGMDVSVKEKLVTFVARNLEPYRGFHTVMRSLPRLLAARPDLKVALVGGDDVSYGARLSTGTWREHFQRELAGKYDASRVLFTGQLPYADYLRLLQRSDAHLYLSYPFVTSWSLREALAVGCAIVASDVEPVREFITDDVTGVIVPGLDHDRVVDAVLALIDDPRRARRLRKAARAFAEAELSLDDYLNRFQARITDIIDRRAA